MVSRRSIWTFPVRVRLLLLPVKKKASSIRNDFQASTFSAPQEAS